jgi:hypothetical protein
VDVAFAEPRYISTGAGRTRVSKMVKAVVRGSGFRPKATGPVVWLNGIATLRTQVAQGGESVEAWFVQPLEALSRAAVKAGRWELIYQPYQGTSVAYRVSPTGDPADAEIKPMIRQIAE